MHECYLVALRKLLVLGIVTSLACSPTVRVHVDIELPSGVPLDPARLHLRAHASCDPRARDSIAPPAPGLADPQSQVWFEQVGGSVTTSLHGGHCTIAITAFYDTNTNGVVDAGDYVAKVPATDVYDRGMCRGNMNDLGSIAAELVK